MRHSCLALCAVIAFTFSLPVSMVSAKSKHNGTCAGFSGSLSGYNFAGIKCSLDTAPGDYVIRYSVKERNDKKAYRDLLSVPKRPMRCTLTKGKTTLDADTYNTAYQITNC